jgi:hypothetical protein
MNAVITIATNGEARCLYTELIDLSSMGSLEIQRASNIEFNNQTQRWEVKDLQGHILHTDPCRAECLAWETQNLQI